MSNKNTTQKYEMPPSTAILTGNMREDKSNIYCLLRDHAMVKDSINYILLLSIIYFIKLKV